MVFLKKGASLPFATGIGFAQGETLSLIRGKKRRSYLRKREGLVKWGMIGIGGDKVLNGGFESRGKERLVSCRKFLPTELLVEGTAALAGENGLGGGG